LASAVAMAGITPISARASILSSKRGFSDVNANYNDLQASGASWYYTWGPGPANPGNFNANFYPMFWDAPSQSTINTVVARHPQYVLGFNEPDNSTQSNMTVAQAIASWKQISAAFTGTATQLVSPAVEDTSTGHQWIENFMSQAKADNLKVNAIAFHWYDDSNPLTPQQDATNFLNSVAWYHNTFKLPVFITEFAVYDWGGGYTTAQMQTGEQQFLNIVIPQLNSLSYVAGYSYYNWFSGLSLYSTHSGISGNPDVPTPLGYAYNGAVGSGTTANISGENLGEHVAYLNGGTLTMTTGTGTVKYIEALANTSDITGTINWGLDPSSSTNWVSVQPGATLYKSGSNTITLGGGTITNDGTIQVAQGVLQIAANTTGSGSILISSASTGSTAQLELSGNIAVTNPITLAQVTNLAQPASIRNVSGTNTLSGPLIISSGGDLVRVQSDSGLLTLSGPVSTNTTTASNLFLQGTGNGVVSGAISDNPINAGGKLNVWKQATGTWDLTGANTYTGTTTVSSGTLLADGSMTSATTVMAGAVLGGNGQINAVVNNSGTISPGHARSAGTLTIASLFVGNSSSLNFILNTPDSAAGVGGNSLIATADTTLGSGIILNINVGSQFGIGVYHLISFSSTINNLPDLNSWIVNGPSGYAYTLTDPAGMINLDVSAVPEPATLALLALGALVLLTRFRGGRSSRQTQA
jgi:autotransporter-associated beta strand protein